MTDGSLLLRLIVAPPSRHVCIRNGDLERLIFQLLRQEDLSMSMAWHSIWHGSERTLYPTRC